MLFYTVCKKLGQPLFRCKYSVTLTGKEYIPKEGPLILCSNHQKVSDPPLLGCYFPRAIRFMAKSELFTDHGKAAGYFLKKFGAFPVKRNSSDTASMKTALELLSQRQVVGIFPQGKCVPPEEPFEAKSGVVLLAKKSKVPILPVWMTYREQQGVRQSVTIRIGQPISYDTLRCSGTIREMTQSLTQVMNQLGGGQNA